MPPLLFLVRHAEAEHNDTVRTRRILTPIFNAFWPLTCRSQHNPYTRDALLTQEGKDQCTILNKLSEPFHQEIDLIIASPLRRTIQTAIYSFGPVLARTELILLPDAQEVSGMPCNVGLDRKELEIEVVKMFEGDDDIPIEDIKINYDGLIEGWNSKVLLFFWFYTFLSQLYP
jgi:broad specificity phosphatase PhoE